MKYIKKFIMLNENSISSELVDYLDSDIIEEYYENNYEVDTSDVNMIAYFVWDNFNEEKFREDFIYDMRNDRMFDDYDDHDFVQYIKEHLTTEKENKILEFYIKNNYDEDEENEETLKEIKELEYEFFMLEELDTDQLKEVIETDDSEDDFISYITKYIYGDYDAEDILSDFYGISEKNYEKRDRFSYSYNQQKYDSFGEELYDRFPQYVDIYGIEKQIKDSEDWYYKKEYVEQNIYDSTKLQRHLLKKGKVLELAELLEENINGDNIGKEYKFQKAYVKAYVKENIIDDEDIKEKGELIADALEYLDNVFGELNPSIERKYHDYMWKVMSKKYNI